MIDEQMANKRTLFILDSNRIGIMVFGFIIVKFSLFVNQLPASIFEMLILLSMVLQYFLVLTYHY
jgi:putative membrane protein